MKESWIRVWHMEAKRVRVLKETEVGQGVVYGSEVVKGVEGE